MLKAGTEGQEQTDRMIYHLHNLSLTAEVHHFHMVSQELDWVEEALLDSKDQWGELATMKLKKIWRLEMADALQRMQEQDEGLIDDALQSVAESSRRGHHAWKGGDVTFPP